MRPSGLLVLLFLLPLDARPQSAQASVAVAVSVGPAASVAEAAISAIPPGTRWVIRQVEHGAHASTIVIAASGTATVASLEVGLDVAGHASLAVGQAVEMVATGAGYLLFVSGQAIAFLPNEAGRALIHHRELGR